MDLNKHKYELLTKIAKLKFVELKQQKEIAEALKMSQVKVSRLLNKAISMGLIKFKVEELSPEISEMERAIEEKYKMNRVILVRAETDDLNVLTQRVGEKAADFLLTIIKDRELIGICQGATVRETVKALPIIIKKQVDVVQILGGSPYELLYGSDGMESTKIFTEKFNIKDPKILYAPLFVDNNFIREAIISDSGIKRTMQYFKSIDLVLVGIGAFNKELNSNLFKLGKISKNEAKELEGKRVVGDIFAHFFDEDGKFVECEVDKRTITISVEDFIKIKYKLAVACGIHKANAIRGALKGRIVNYLVTDTAIGEKLLDLN